MLIRRADGGSAPPYTISREADAEILSHGRRQSPDLDLNMTPPPGIYAPVGPIETSPSVGWWSGPIDTDIGSGHMRLPRRQRLGFGGTIHRDDGGSVPQTLATQNPIDQQLYTHYSQMTPEQLQETALRLKGSPQGHMAQMALARSRMAVQPVSFGQPAAPAAPDPSGPPQQYALGGTLEAKGGMRMPERGINSGATPASTSGFLHTAGPGRSDNLQIKPHANSYVLPADLVSSLGEGNSLAGAKALDQSFHTGPYGVPMPSAGPRHTGHRMGPPHMAAGGMSRKRVPIVAAGGEYIVSPEQVAALGGGDIDRGHAILDAFVLHIRKRTIKELKGLKGPVKS